MATEPQGHDYFRGVAPVPPRRPATVPESAEPSPDPLPETRLDTRREVPRTRRPGQPVGTPPGMIVRRRWRRVRSGAGWTWAGAIVVLACWGIWAISIRGVDLVAPVLGLVLVLAVAGLLFVLARLLGRAVLEQALGRERTSAWPSHLTVGGFLTLAGIGFLQQTRWITDSWQWFGDSWQWVLDSWQWLLDLWPF